MNLIDYLPPVLQDIGEYVQLTNAEQTQFDAVDTALGGVADDLFLSTLTENGASRWEDILNITAKGTDTLTVRRFRIFAKMNEQTPYTITSLKEKLQNLCGSDGYSVVLVPGDYSLTVKVALTAKKYFDEVEALLERIVPANLVVSLALLYNQHSTLAAFTHAQLKEYSHYQIRNEVVS